MSPQFDTTPEKEGSIGGFLYRQLTTTPQEVRGVSLAGKTAIVTGSNTGCGLEVARQFLDLGVSRLILAVRDEEKGKTAVDNLRQNRDAESSTIEVWKLDLDDYASVVAFADGCNTLERLDIAVLNAGLYLTQHETSPTTGHDRVIQVNYLSTVLLLTLLLPVAATKRHNQDAPTRITLTSSDVSAWTSFKERNAVPLFPALDSFDGADPLDRMMVSKLLGQFYLAELAKRVPASVATTNCATPGMLHGSDFNRQMRGTITGRLVGIWGRLIGYSAAVGARNITEAAVRHGEESHGQYLSTQKIKPMAPILYTEEGKRISDQLWRETMTEFAFAGVEDIITRLSTA
ncbi:putative short-chain dehydrogenase [Plectosphaerella plurivora]|uniref:Short-chain dehydrogenase n=1 Tax=Plectosphaerella plurivora TaxID=936078 RepID=A0A9P8VI74_9PEZI|nr:putative short-chain dehydrogenase [Plectosphaerella plurivora]